MSGRIAYLCLQATTQGQASYAHVHEIIEGLRETGWSVELHEPSYAGGQAPGVLGRLYEFWRLQRRLRRQLRSFDAIYIRGHALALPTSRAAARLGIPVVQEINGPVEDFFLAWPSARALHGTIASWTYAQYREATALIAVTPELAAWVARVAGRSDTAVIPNGANVDLFAPTEEGRSIAPAPDDRSHPGRELPQRYVVFFGALAPWQGTKTCLDAVASSLWPRDVALVVAGDGALRPEVEAAARARRGTESAQVVYVGSVPYRDVPGLVAGALASLVPMHQPERDDRGLAPLKLFESMACGVPVIVSATGGMDTLVRQVGAGLSFASGDASALAQAVATVAADPEMAARMGAAGRQYAVDHASWDARARATAEVIDAAIARQAGRRARGAGDADATDAEAIAADAAGADRSIGEEAD